MKVTRDKSKAKESSKFLQETNKKRLKSVRNHQNYICSFMSTSRNKYCIQDKTNFISQLGKNDQEKVKRFFNHFQGKVLQCVIITHFFLLLAINLVVVCFRFLNSLNIKSFFFSSSRHVKINLDFNVDLWNLKRAGIIFVMVVVLFGICRPVPFFT